MAAQASRYVKRSVWYTGGNLYRSSEQIRHTSTYVVAYDDGEKVHIYLDEDDILEYYGRKRITYGLLDKLGEDLRGEWLEYHEDKNGFYWLDGCLSDYI